MSEPQKSKLPAAFRDDDDDDRVNPWAQKPKLRPCPDCGHQISSSAVACPSCGRRIAFAMPIFAAIFCAAIVLSIFGAILIALLQTISPPR